MTKKPLVITRKRLVVFTVVWAAGLLLMILAMTDLFRESLFRKNHLFSLLNFMLLPTVSFVLLLSMYRKHKAQQTS
ncbi:hypothetical protein [Flaviaesturariibacter terrae]